MWVTLQFCSLMSYGPFRRGRTGGIFFLLSSSLFVLFSIPCSHFLNLSPLSPFPPISSSPFLLPTLLPLPHFALHPPSFWWKFWTGPFLKGPGAVARSEANPFGMQAVPSSIPTSSTFFRGDLIMKTFLRPFSLFRWFKKSSCQLPAKECALSTGKLPGRLAQEQCG